MRTPRLSTAIAAICTSALACSSTVLSSSSPTQPAATATTYLVTVQPAPSLAATPQQSALATPTVPPPAPLATLPTATRIAFQTGTTAAVITGHILAGDVKAYVLQAEQARPMIVRLDSANEDLALSIKTQGGTSLLSPLSRQSSWRGALPRTEDYYLGIYGGGGEQDFTLTVQLAMRIKFKEGEDITTVGGKIATGSLGVYSVFATEGQRMEVTLSGTGREAALGIEGFFDQKSYLAASAGKTNFVVNVPATQDYLIEIVPKVSKNLTFILDVRLK